jgi:hypothetical protein
MIRRPLDILAEPSKMKRMAIYGLQVGRCPQDPAQRASRTLVKGYCDGAEGSFSNAGIVTTSEGRRSIKDRISHKLSQRSIGSVMSLHRAPDSILFRTCLLCKMEKAQRPAECRACSIDFWIEREVICVYWRTWRPRCPSDSSNLHIISSYPSSHVHLSIHVRHPNLLYLSLPYSLVSPTH